MRYYLLLLCLVYHCIASTQPSSRTSINDKKYGASGISSSFDDSKFDDPILDRLFVHESGELKEYYFNDMKVVDLVVRNDSIVEESNYTFYYNDYFGSGGEDVYLYFDSTLQLRAMEFSNSMEYARFYPNGSLDEVVVKVDTVKEAMYQYYKFYPDGQLQIQGVYADSISKPLIEVSGYRDQTVIIGIRTKLLHRNQVWFYYSPTGILNYTREFDFFRENLPVDSLDIKSGIGWKYPRMHTVDSNP